MKKEGITDSDIRDLSLGAFSRVWVNQIHFNNIFLYQSLTLYGITPEA
jgi:hypothetical protein